MDYTCILHAYVFCHEPFVCMIMSCTTSIMGWLRLEGSLKLQVSFAKEPYNADHILQKRPMILRSLLMGATSYTYIRIHIMYVLHEIINMHVLCIFLFFFSLSLALPLSLSPPLPTSVSLRLLMLVALLQQMCCSVLQCVAVWCSLLQCDADVLQYVAEVLQMCCRCVAVW